jgi:hypothetical protein
MATIDIDDAIAFAHEYAELQFAHSKELFKNGEKALSSSPKVASTRRSVEKLAARGARVFADGCSSKLGANGKRTMVNTPRTLFAVTQHKSKHGDLFVLHMSGHNREKDSYDERVFVIVVDGALKIVGKLSACVICAATGKQKDGKRCSECRGKAMWTKDVGGWGAKDGVNLQKPGKHVDVRKLTPPARPEHRAHYDAL